MWQTQPIRVPFRLFTQITVADAGGQGAILPPPQSPVKISHKKDGRQRQPHSIDFMFLGPSYPAAGQTTELVSEGSRISQRGCQPPKGRLPIHYSAEDSWKLHENEKNWAVLGGYTRWSKLVGHLPLNEQMRANSKANCVPVLAKLVIMNFNSIAFNTQLIHTSHECFLRWNSWTLNKLRSLHINIAEILF